MKKKIILWGALLSMLGGLLFFSSGKALADTVPPCACDGRITKLTLKYNGTNQATIKVVQRQDEQAIFNESVAAGGNFSFEGKDKQGTTGPEIIIYVNGIEQTRIHTSCSEPIYVGMVSGDFEIIAGESRNGGPLCSKDSQCSNGQIWDETKKACANPYFGIFVECITPDKDGAGYTVRFGYKWDGTVNVNLTRSDFTGPKTDKIPPTVVEPGRHLFDIHSETNGNLVWTVSLNGETKTTTVNESYQKQCSDEPNPDIPEVNYPVFLALTGLGMILSLFLGYSLGSRMGGKNKNVKSGVKTTAKRRTRKKK